MKRCWKEREREGGGERRRERERERVKRRDIKFLSSTYLKFFISKQQS